MDVVAYEAFKKKRAKDFRSIAARTKGDCSVEELHNEAWIVAEDYLAERGFDIDWSTPTDQDLVLERLTAKYVSQERRKRKCTISVDQERIDHEGNTTTLIDLLPAEEISDPLTLLERSEEEEENSIQREQENAILESYSQSVAYNIALWHFDNLRYQLAAHLAINRNTLTDRINAAAMALKAQPSIFDGVETIDETFIPERSYGRPNWLPVKLQLDNAQWCWEFEEDIQPVQSALSLLRHNELCEVVIDGTTRKARWHQTTRLFFFIDGDRPVFCPGSGTQEWWPASAKL